MLVFSDNVATVLAIFLVGLLSYAKAENLATDLANWMANLPIKLQNIPLNQLIIPGSHDSLTHALDQKYGLSPGNPDIINTLLKVLGKTVTKKIVYQWSVTQNLTATEQLEAGVRYFDLRLAAVTISGRREIRIVHGLYGDTIENSLDEIKEFLVHHPKEVVLLHVQHVYEFYDYDHRQVQEAFLSRYSSLMVKFKDSDVQKLTLQNLWSKNKQVLVFYDYPSDGSRSPLLWPNFKIPNPWPNKDDIPSLTSFWTKYTQEKHRKDEFAVFQGVGTPQTKTVLYRPLGFLRFEVASKVNQALLEFLQDKIQKKDYISKINIVMFDFVNSEVPELAAVIVNMNQAYL